MSGFDLIHTYSSDALAQGILKSFFAFTNFFMPLPRSEPVAPNRPRLSGKHGMHSPNSLTMSLCVRRYVCMYVRISVSYDNMYMYVLCISQPFEECQRYTNIHKGSIRDIDNYRQISLLSNISKVFEKSVFKHVFLFRISLVSSQGNLQWGEGGG